MPKPDVTLHPIDIERLPWDRPDGAIDGVSERILTLDPATGSATRILRVEPYVDTGIFTHDHWEEVWMLEGSYKMGSELHPTGTYTCKGPDVVHGPFMTNDGYLGLEFRDYLPDTMDKARTVLLPLDVERIPWTPAPDAPGAEERVLTAGPSGSQTRLLRIPAGGEVPPRTLDAHEEWWVMAGAAKIGDTYLPAGSFVSRSPGFVTGTTLAESDYLALEIRNVW